MISLRPEEFPTGIRDFAAALALYEERPLEDLPDELWSAIDEHRTAAVGAGDEDLAKRIWCLEQIAEFQDKFVRAFRHMKSDEFYAGWCALERAEVTLGFLTAHTGVLEE